VCRCLLCCMLVVCTQIAESCTMSHTKPDKYNGCFDVVNRDMHRRRQLQQFTCSMIKQPQQPLCLLLTCPPAATAPKCELRWLARFQKQHCRTVSAAQAVSAQGLCMSLAVCCSCTAMHPGVLCRPMLQVC
jgi:hypothetical protein